MYETPSRSSARRTMATSGATDATTGSSQSSSPRPFITTRSASLIAAMSRGDGSNVSTTPPLGTRLVTATSAPPTCWTMSARTVVVATTRSPLPLGVAPASEQPATATLSRSNNRTSSRRIGRSRLRRRAARAAPEQLEPVAVDPITGPALDRADDVPDPGVVDLGRPAAALADDVVVMGRLAADIGVITVRQVDPLDDVQLVEGVEGPEHRRPADIESLCPGVGEDVGGRERPVPLGDERSHGTARLGQAHAGAVEGGDERGWISHDPRRYSVSCALSRLSLNGDRSRRPTYWRRGTFGRRRIRAGIERLGPRLLDAACTVSPQLPGKNDDCRSSAPADAKIDQGDGPVPGADRCVRVDLDR